ncbi:hypothetical protein GGS23DRAFT_593881 [Durotheca rogersii]|uniref:uncharacterized protein n=1 Tax=Durotheca rogersii TaxID=419775 RepID=UPI00221EF152|nr:uncharacterized protein GGS23DRAFT_593881 [Durotheca rogersii]KAI5865703.1 hypothetical protein GGS23DRAFT_593881 [Durotheca rogersii]
MLKNTVALAAAFAQLANAHFLVQYPSWRAETLDVPEGSDYDQWAYPCAGVPTGAGNRTDWPLTGGSIKLHLYHPWSYLFINLGFGANTTNFNVSLTPNIVNVTSNGVICLPQVPVPVNVSDGQLASLQIVTSGSTGAALYNCADITFRSSAQLLDSNECRNDTDITAVIVGSSSAAETPATPAESTPPSAAPGTTVGGWTLAAAVGLAFAFVAGV